MADCPICPSPSASTDDNNILWQDVHCKVIRVDDADYPGYCRVIWHAHVAEMSDLTIVEQRHLMDVVLAAERSLRALMKPDKINLASLGNQVPHLHWHVIARFADDRHFPASIWSQAQHARPVAARPHPSPTNTELAAHLARELGSC